jgi:hypothetical protein
MWLNTKYGTRFFRAGKAANGKLKPNGSLAEFGDINRLVQNPAKILPRFRKEFLLPAIFARKSLQ